MAKVGIRVFPRPFTHGGNLSPPPIWGGTSAGGQSVNRGTHEGGLMRGTHEGGHRPYGGGGLTLIDYLIN